MTHLLDTDHISILQRRGLGYAALVANLALHPEEDVGVSVVSLHEQFVGAHAHINAARSPAGVVRGYELLFAVIADYREFPLAPFDAAASAEFDQLKAQKLRIGTMDRRIAAIALSRSLVLVTRNVTDFGQVPGLRTEDWTK